MKRSIIILSIALLTKVAYTQRDAFECGTMQNLVELQQTYPEVILTMDSIEEFTRNWSANSLFARGTINYNPNTVVKINSKSLCGYNNVYYTTIASPTTLNQIVSPSPNCTYGGEYVRVTNMIAGRTYRISTCGVNNFDTQLTIWDAAGTYTAGHNDDWCGTQSEIYFTPIITGNYDILIDQYDCSSNSLCASLAVELWYIPRPVITIPVVVHVIHDGEAIGSGSNISVAQIQSQIDVLNEDFRRLNSDIYTAVPSPFRGTSMDTRIQFCLAVRDPSGNPTTGITRIQGSQTTYTQSEVDVLVKPSTIWDRNKYLNLWSVEFGGSSSGLIGYAQFPGGPANTDGVVLRYNSFGTVGNVTPPYDLGRPGSHEVGHWLNLRHVWGDEPACAQDDFCNDTPLQSSEQYGCPSFPITDGCSPNYPGVNFVNYMDYTNDNCKAMFSFDQFVRMDAALFGPRNSLQSSLGCTPGASPSANFVANVTSGVAPLTVNFTDLSTNSPTSWAWTFYGGATQASSTLQNPTGITWSTPGLKNVRLIATNAWGNDTELKTNYINVVSGVGINEPDYIFQIFPNPTTSTVNILCSIDKPDAKLTIVNTIGQVILEKNVSIVQNQVLAIDISNLASGFYFVNLDGAQSRLLKE